MLWIKAFHIVFVVSWFAGLLYLPRLFIYHIETEDEAGHERFVRMEHKLFIIMTIAAVLATVLGLSLIMLVPAFLTMGWMHVKLTLVLALLGYHAYCWKIKGEFARKTNTRSGRWYRIFNEVPALILVGVVILVEVKPF